PSGQARHISSRDMLWQRNAASIGLLSNTRYTPRQLLSKCAPLRRKLVLFPRAGICGPCHKVRQSCREPGRDRIESALSTLWNQERTSSSPLFSHRELQLIRKERHPIRQCFDPVVQRKHRGMPPKPAVVENDGVL